MTPCRVTVAIPMTEPGAQLAVPTLMPDVWHPGSMTLLVLAGGGAIAARAR